VFHKGAAKGLVWIHYAHQGYAHA